MKTMFCTSKIRSALLRRASLVLLGIATAAVLLLPSQVLAQSALLRSLVIPGSGQAHQGNYKKAAIFAGAFVATGAGLLVSSIHYGKAVDRFRQEKRIFNALLEDQSQGKVISAGEFNSTVTNMQNAFNDADDRQKWRDAFLVGLIVTYSANVIDVVMSKPHDTDVALKYNLDVDRERVLLTRSFRF